jgi:MFS family permease
MMPASRLTPRPTMRFGTRRVCAAGLVLVAAGLAVISELHADSSYSLMAVGLIVLGTGMGIAMTPATSAITEALPAEQQGVGSALNDLARELGGAIGIAVIGSVLAATYRSRVDVTGLSAAAGAKVKASYAVASQLPAPISDRAHSAFVAGMHIALLTAAGAVLAAAGGVALLLARRRSARSCGEAGDSAPELRRQLRPRRGRGGGDDDRGRTSAADDAGDLPVTSAGAGGIAVDHA